MARILSPLRPAAELTPATVAAMCQDAADLAAMFYEAMGASTPVDPNWPLCAAVLLDQFARLGQEG